MLISCKHLVEERNALFLSTKLSAQSKSGPWLSLNLEFLPLNFLSNMIPDQFHSDSKQLTNYDHKEGDNLFVKWVCSWC